MEKKENQEGEITKWFTPSGKGLGEKMIREERKKRKELSPGEEEEKRRKRKSEGDEEGTRRTDVFARSNLMQRSPPGKVEKKTETEKEGKLDIEMMVKMITEKQKEAIEELSEKIMEKQEEELRRLKEDLKKRDEKKEKEWEEKWRRWEKEAREREEERERKEWERYESRRREDKEESERLEGRIAKIEREWTERREMDYSGEEREREWEEMKREFERWRKNREEEKETVSKGKKEGRSREEEVKEQRIQKMAEEIEKEKKRKNIVITGLQGDWTRESLRVWLKRKIDVEANLVEVWRVGEGRERIVARCRNEEEKERIMRNKKNLGRERVFIENDLTYKERRMRERAVEKARDLRKQGLKVKAGMNKVFGEKDDWVWDNKEEKWFQKRRTEDKGERNVHMECSGEQQDG